MTSRELIDWVGRNPEQQAEAREMIALGITRSITEVFHYKNYRYSRVSDAIAQARREAASVSSLDKAK